MYTDKHVYTSLVFDTFLNLESSHSHQSQGREREQPSGGECFILSSIILPQSHMLFTSEPADLPW